MNLPILGNVFIINNLRTEVPNTVDDAEVLDAALRTVGFNVKIHNDCTVQVRVHYHPQRSCGKVMFLHLTVIMFTEGCLAYSPLGQVHPTATTPLGQVHPPAGTPPATPRIHTPPGRYTSWQPYPPPSRYIPPPVTAADGTHPTGMFSCSLSIYIVRGEGHRKFLTPT